MAGPGREREDPLSRFRKEDLDRISPEWRARLAEVLSKPLNLMAVERGVAASNRRHFNVGPDVEIRYG